MTDSSGTGGTWRYIAARETVSTVIPDDHLWSIRELYTGHLGTGWSDSPRYPCGEDRDELKNSLEMMLADLKDGAWLDLDTGEIHGGGVA